MSDMSEAIARTRDPRVTSLLQRYTDFVCRHFASRKEKAQCIEEAYQLGVLSGIQAAKFYHRGEN